jgi:hypothetical protein
VVAAPADAGAGRRDLRRRPVERRHRTCDAYTKSTGGAYDVPGAYTRIARLDLPEGYYVITAKGQAWNRSSFMASVDCSLSTGGQSFDWSNSVLSPLGQGGQVAAWTLSGANFIPREWGVELYCQDYSNAVTWLQDVRLTAIRVRDGPRLG